MKINYGLVFMILVIIALVLTGLTVILLQRAYGRSLELGMVYPATVPDGLLFSRVSRSAANTLPALQRAS